MAAVVARLSAELKDVDDVGLGVRGGRIRSHHFFSVVRLLLLRRVKLVLIVEIVAFWDGFLFVISTVLKSALVPLITAPRP